MCKDSVLSRCFSLSSLEDTSEQQQCPRPAPGAPRQPPRQVSTARDDTPPDPPPDAGGRAFVDYWLHL